MIRGASCGLLLLVLAGVTSGQTADVVQGSIPGPGGRPPRPIRPTLTQAGPVKLDRHGDPLPAGAVARFGTVRLRHGAEIYAMAFSLDAKRLCTASATQDSVKLWDTATGKEVAHLSTTASLVGLANDGAVVLIDDARCKVWLPAANTTRDLPDKTLPAGANPSALAVNPDGRSFAVALAGGVRVVDAQTGKTLRELNTPGSPAQNNNPRPGGIVPNAPGNNGNPQQTPPTTRLLYSPDGRWLVGSGQRTGVWLWDLRTGKRVRTYPSEAQFPEYAFSPDVTKLAVAGERLHLYALDSEEPVEGFKGLPDSPQTFAPRFSADGKTLFAVYANGAVQPFDAATGEEGDALLTPGEENMRPPFALAAQGALVAAVDQTGGIRIWDPKTGKGPEVARLPGLLEVGFSADGKNATVLDLVNKVHAFDLATGAPGKVVELDGIDEGLPATWEPGARRVAVGVPTGDEIEVHVIDADTKKVISRHATPPGNGFATVSFAARNRDRLALFGQTAVLVVNPTTGKAVRTLDVKPGPNNGGVRGALSPDGRVVAGTTGQGVMVWEVATGKQRFEFDAVQNAGAMAFSPDSRLLAVWEGAGAVSVYDLRTGALVRKIQNADTGESVSALAFSPDGKRLAGGFHTGHVTVWDVGTGDTLAPFAGHDGEVSGLCFSADGARLVSSSRDGTALVWAVPETPQPTGPAEAAVSGYDEAFRLLGATDAAQAQRGLDYLYRRPADAPKQIAARVPAPTPTPAAALAKHVADLASDDFATREAAAKALEAVGGEAGPPLRAAVEKSASAEVRKQANELLGKLDAPATKPADLRALRAVEALEGLNTPEARGLLEKWAGGPAGHRVTTEAAAALARLKR